MKEWSVACLISRVDDSVAPATLAHTTGLELICRTRVRTLYSLLSSYEYRMLAVADPSVYES